MSFLHDLAYSLRTLRKNPWFTFTAVVSLAIGIGASTTMFTLIDAFLLRALPGVHEPRRLVNVRLREAGDINFLSFSWPALRDLQQADTATTGLATFSDHPFSFTRHGEAQLVAGQIVSANYFDVLGVKPFQGRFFVPDEDGLANVRAVAVVSYTFWQRRLGGDPRALDSQIMLNGVPLTVVGIAPKGFGGTFVGFVYEFWVPNGMAPLLLQRHGLFERKNRWFEVVGRLRPGASVAQARASMNTIYQRLARIYPEERNLEVVPSTVTGFDLELRGGVIAFLSILMGVSLFVLVIACINVANLVLARGVSRSKEIAIRVALGMGRKRLVRQLLTESVALAVLGGAVGVLAAGWGVALLRSLEPPVGIPLVFDFTIDVRILGFALLVSLLSGAAFGLLPALQVSRHEPVSALKESATRTAGGARLRGLFVVGQVAVSALLLITAGLFLRALQHAASLTPGFEPRGVEIVTLDPSVLGYDAAKSRDFFLRLQDRLAALPGVEKVAMANKTPLGFGSLFGGQRTTLRVEGREPPPGVDGFKVEFNAVGPGYLEVLHIPLLRGREFRPQDLADTPPVALVNETMARHFWPGQDAVGKRFWHEGHWVDIVGLARDSKYVRVTEAPRDHLFLAFTQRPSPQMTYFLRTPQSAASLAPAVRAEVRRSAPGLPILNLMTMNESIAISRLPQRVAAAVATSLGATGLLLATVGLYGVVAYSVSQRRRELSIRMALGADRGDIRRLIVQQGVLLAVAGVVTGTLGALALSHVLAGLLFGLSPSDPVTFGGISVLLLAVSAVASLLPASRAARTDPMAMFRQG
jgi:predicted permease